MSGAALRQVAPVVETNVLDAYISGLAPSGRRGITSLLNRSAGILKRGADAASYPWEQLSFAAVAKVRAALLDNGYAVSSVNMALSALRGIAQTAFNLNYLGRTPLPVSGQLSASMAITSARAGLSAGRMFVRSFRPLNGIHNVSAAVVMSPL